MYVCRVFISNADAQACVNTNITSWTGDITSPGYGSYQPNLDCYWLIQVAEGNVVEIEFQDFSVRNRGVQIRLKFFSFSWFSSVTSNDNLSLHFQMTSSADDSVGQKFLFFL